MCGIVGVIANSKAILSAEKKVFNQMLQIDTLRGPDSTGVAVTDAKANVATYKYAVDGYAFTSMKQYQKLMTAAHSPTLLLGHNRWATTGLVNHENAHPFECDDITMVHNGSLKTWTNLHKSSETDVDSQAICYNIAHEGLKATVEKLNGAFTLVVFNSTDNTVSFVRNDERPLWLAEHKTKDILFFASEPEMIQLACSRNSIDINEPWSLNTEVIVTYDLGAKNVLSTESVEEVKFYTPPASAKSSSHWWDDDNYHYNRYGSYGSTKYPTLWEKHKLTPNDKVVFIPTDYEFPTSVKNTKVNLMGEICDRTTGEIIDYGYAYSAVEENDATRMLYCPYVTSVSSFTLPPRATERVLNVIHTNSKMMSAEEAGKFFEKYDETNSTGNKDSNVILLPDSNKDSEEEGEDDSPSFCGPDGRLVDSDEFGQLVEHGCAVCCSPIDVSVAASFNVEYVFENQPICQDCVNINFDGKSGSELEDAIMTMAI